MVIGTDLNDAWRNALWECVKFGHEYQIEKGSYKGEYRKQLDSLALLVQEPYKRPFRFYTPPGIPEPTDEDKINKYFYDYLVCMDKQDNEDYTYGMYIGCQITKAIDILNEARGKTNQASINIGGTENIDMEDPPCLRTIDFKVIDNKLILSGYFRSWDLFAALPENLGGLQLLKEYVGLHLSFDYEDGPMYIYSSGAHVYSMYYPIVNQLNVHQLELKE